MKRLLNNICDILMKILTWNRNKLVVETKNKKIVVQFESESKPMLSAPTKKNANRNTFILSYDDQSVDLTVFRAVRSKLNFKAAMKDRLYFKWTATSEYICFFLRHWHSLTANKQCQFLVAQRRRWFTWLQHFQNWHSKWKPKFTQFLTVRTVFMFFFHVFRQKFRTFNHLIYMNTDSLNPHVRMCSQTFTWIYMDFRM